jgi:polysaccharide deacetylase family protein (PEP-CTERM system associated)
MRHALTIDVEEWFHVCGIERIVPREAWDTLPSRVEESTRRVLDLLDRHGARATFIVLGWVAQRHPELIREIRAAGHEIGSHGMWHRKVFQQHPEEFEADVRASRDLLCSITGEAPTAYRAPEWSIDAPRREWAYPILARLGFRDDSSVNPCTWITGALETEPFVWKAPSDDVRDSGGTASLRVFPVTTMRMYWENLPFTGGTSFRVSPYWYTLRFFERLGRRGVPGMVYVHPWEFDYDQPKLPLGRVVRFMHGFNLREVARRLAALLRHFEFGTLSESLDQVAPRPVPCGVAARAARTTAGSVA